MNYVMSDIHGNNEAFNTIISMINLQPEDHLYILGDVIDRGEYGIELLQLIKKMENCTLLLGNHELMMIKALRNLNSEQDLFIWMNNSCDHTIEKYINLSSDEQKDLLEYLESLPVQLEIEAGGRNYLLVHAAPLEIFNQLNQQYSSPEEFAVWHRLGFEEDLPEGKTVIHGHTPTKFIINGMWPKMRILHNDGAVNIDCGCPYPRYGGQLGCLRLEDLTEYYSDEGIVKSIRYGEMK